MMLDYLDQLREKPVHVRTRIAFGTAAVVTLAVAGVWTTTLPAVFSELGQSASVASSTSISDLRNVAAEAQNELQETKAEMKDIADTQKDTLQAIVDLYNAASTTTTTPPQMEPTVVQIATTSVRQD